MVKEFSPNGFDYQRTARIVKELELAATRKHHPIVLEQEIAWRNNLLPNAELRQDTIKQAAQAVLDEELRLAKLHAARQEQPLLDHTIYEMLAYLMIYGHNQQTKS